MKIAAAVFCDFNEAPLGLPSRLMSDLNGRRVIGHTLRRVSRIEGVAHRYLICRAAHADAAARVLAEAELADAFELLPTDPGVRPRAGLTRAARRWSIETWRGHPLGLTWYDEYIDPNVVAAVLGGRDDDAWLCVDGHQAALDVELADAMIRHMLEYKEEAPYVFSQAPPGLSGVLLSRVAVGDLLRLETPFGLLLSYRPEIATNDPVTASVCYHVPPILEQTAARVVPDTVRSMELLSRALSELGDDVGAAVLCAWYARPENGRAGDLPVEVEIELTTDDPLPDTILRPRGRRVPRRRLADLAALERLAAELTRYDDRLVVLGGHGDPLQHPAFPDACRILRRAGVLGLAVATPLVELSDAALTAFFEAPVDVVEVLVDAHCAETYRRVHGRDAFDAVRANVERIDALRVERHSPQPIVVGSLTRHADTLSDLEPFYEQWIRTTGAAVLRGYSQYGGLLPSDTLLPTMPTVRAPCRRLASRLTLSADGSTPPCMQDVPGAASMGDWTSDTLASIWGGPVLGELRNRHERLDLAGVAPCQNCQEWSRP